MMPVIVICLILKKQLGLIFHYDPSQNKLAGPVELLDDAPYRFCAQVRAADLPGCAWGGLFPLQQARLDESFDVRVRLKSGSCCMMTVPCIRQRTFAEGYRGLRWSAEWRSARTDSKALLCLDALGHAA
jgi:hypothetical protein